MNKINIPHLHSMKAIDFISVIEELSMFGGELSNSTVDISEKIDGAGIRIGVNPASRFFFESSRSGLIFNPGEFGRYNLNKFGKTSRFSDAYDKAFDILKADKRIHELLKVEQCKRSIDMLKVHGEMLMNDLGKEKDGKIRFVATDYDVEKLGKIVTFIFFSTSKNGNKIKFTSPGFRSNNNYDPIIEKLKKLSTSNVKFEGNEILIDPIDFKKEILLVNEFLKMSDYKKILTSSKLIDQQLKHEIMNFISSIQKNMSQKILSNLPKGKLGNDIEGIVVNLKHSNFKVITEKFKKEKKKEDIKWAEM